MLCYFVVSCMFTGALNDVWGYTEPYLRAVWQNRLCLYTAAAVLIGLWFTVNVGFRKVTSLISFMTCCSFSYFASFKLSIYDLMDCLFI